MSDVVLGERIAVVKRSPWGMLVGIAFLAIALGGVIAWNVLRHPGKAGAVLGAIVTLITIPAGWSYARMVWTVDVHERGLAPRRPRGKALAISWKQITEGRVYRAPLGQRPQVVELFIAERGTLRISEAEYDNVGPLIDAALAKCDGRVKDERAA